MNEVIKAIKERRSIRAFKPDMPAKTDLDQIVEAGLFAANANSKQSPIILAITNSDLRAKFVEANARVGNMKEGFDPFYGAPVIFVILVKRDWACKIYDGSLVIGNMMLAAHSLGLGSIWIHRAKEEFETPEFQELLTKLGIEGEWEGIGHCAVGYIKGDAPKPHPLKENRVFWIE